MYKRQGYEMTLDDLRERMQQAERTSEEQTAQLERLRSDLSLSRSHEQDLAKTLNNVCLLYTSRCV